MERTDLIDRLLDLVVGAREDRRAGGATTGDRRPARPIIALAGPQALGKTTTSRQLTERGRIRGRRVEVLPADRFLLDRAVRRARALAGAHPDAVDAAALAAALEAAARGATVRYRPFDHRTGRHADAREIEPGWDALLVEGIHAMHPAIVHLLDLRIVFRADPEDLQRFRVHADLERGYRPEEAEPHAAFEVAGFREHIGDQSSEADWIVDVDGRWDCALVRGPRGRAPDA